MTATSGTPHDGFGPTRATTETCPECGWEQETARGVFHTWYCRQCRREMPTPATPPVAPGSDSDGSGYAQHVVDTLRAENERLRAELEVTRLALANAVTPPRVVLSASATGTAPSDTLRAQLAESERHAATLYERLIAAERERDAACEDAARLRQRHEIALREIAASHNRLRDLQYPGTADCCCEWCDDHRAARPATEVDRA